jgi:DedD protein
MSSEGAGTDAAAARAGQAAAIRVRMRRRLIGAAALLVGTAVVVPMMLDPAPRPLADNIPVDIPSERTPFAPRLSLPADARLPSDARGVKEGSPAPAQGAAPAGAANQAAGAAAGAIEAKPAESNATGRPIEGASGTEPVDQPPDSAPRSSAGSEPAVGAPGATAGQPKEGEWFVQAAALSSESAARQLSERLTKAGMAPFIERTENSGSMLYRVRLGPFPSREAAVKVRRHLHAMGVGSNVVRVAQAER